jgi:hypothetical protein
MRDCVAIADVVIDVVFFDHFPHVFEDFFGCSDRRADPRLEPITECVEVAVRAHTWIGMGNPSASETVLGFQDCVALSGHLLGQMICGTDSRNALRQQSIRRNGFCSAPVRSAVKVLVCDTGNSFSR